MLVILLRTKAAALLALLAIGCVDAVTTRGGADGAATDAGDPRDAHASTDAPAADAPLPDGAVPDGGTPDAFVPDAGPPPPSGRVVYPGDRSLSPITVDVAEGLRAIAARATAREDVFSKIGDSLTVSTSFLDCFDGTNVDLDGRDPLRATIDHFAAADVGGTTPFSRTSLSATVGWSASAPIAGSPSPLERELDAIDPRYASVLYGTNDVGFRSPFDYADDMLDITDTLLERGVIPVMSSMPPRDDSASADARVPLFNLVVRGIAQGRQVPFVDLHREMLPLVSHGLLTSDHLHPNQFSGGACILTSAGLGFGHNVRNLLVLRALDAARRALASEAAPDLDAPRTSGTGAFETPFAVPSFPFTDLRSTSLSGARRIGLYDGCAATQNESGPELYYRLEIAAATHLHAWVFDRGAVDIDVHLLDASGASTGCLARAHQDLEADVGPGTYYLVLDSWTGADAVEHSGEYLLVLTAS